MNPAGTAVVERSLDAIERAKDLCITVAGPAVLQQLRRCRPRRRLRSGVPPWLEVVTTELDGGDAAAAALALAAMGAQVRLVAAVGDDRAAAGLRTLLRAAGIADTDVVAAPGRCTPTTSTLVVAQRVVARFDEGLDAEPEADLEADLARRLHAAAADSDAVLLVTANHEPTPPQGPAALDPLLTSHPCLVVTGTRPATAAALTPRMTVLDIDVVAELVRDGERATTLPASAERARWLASQEELLRRRTGAGAVAVSLVNEGAVVLTDGAVLYTPPGPAPRGGEDPLGSAWAPAMTLALATGHDVLAATHLAAATLDVPRRHPRADATDGELLREAVRRRRPPLPLAPEPRPQGDVGR